jgi:HlyD family secretion protein
MPGQTFPGKVTEIGNSPIQTTGGSAATQATNFKVVVTLDKEIAEVRPGFTCTAEITTAVRDNAIAVPIQATTVREVVVDDKGNIVRAPEDDKKSRRPSMGAAQAAELKPGQTRKELEGVFVIQNNKAVFMPVKTGIAGEKYFEVLSGLKEGDAVITGPFASVRTLAEGAAVKQSTAAKPKS